ncbi:SET methyltransferase domain containing protein [Nitzschia inconspicua]|uniref:SET methyltransferase domain containing protein n=1 Tax=Nitzschia inconspicua TaxID=303405 RepID=A0A9K3M3H6_9STRA|nr:SET methyltransferase domain containing protein [Nitzschia inconspicua]
MSASSNSASSIRRRSGSPKDDLEDVEAPALQRQENMQRPSSFCLSMKNCSVPYLAAIVLFLAFCAWEYLPPKSITMTESDFGFNLRSREVPTSSQPQCGIWMAPGSLRPYPGFGIYTTRDVKQNEKFLHAPDAISVQVLEPHRYNNMPLEDERWRWWKLFQNYAWDNSVPDHSIYSHPLGDMTDFQPGFGSLPNHHCILNSLSSRSPDIPYDDEVVDRRTSPGLGAFSYTLGREWVSKRDVKAGEELFLSYGFCERTKEKNKWSWADKMYMPEDFEEAARIVKMFEPFGTQAWPKTNLTIARLIDPAANADPKLVYDILPKTTKELVMLVQAVDAHAFDKDAADEELLRQLALGVTEQRTPEWIRQNGMCLENLVPKKSTLPDAGWGGFAQYTIQKDDIIVPMPVFHMENYEILNLYRRDVNVLSDPEKYQIGKNLFLNYCFVRSESSMALCPMTSAVLVNHCGERINDGKCEANAKVRWSSGWDPPSHEWRNKTIEELAQHNARALSLELVATKTIAPGDEVFIDYGPEWEQAWAEHVKKWKAPKVPDNFLSAKQANLHNDSAIPDEMISFNLRKTVDHPYLFTGCFYRTGKADVNDTRYDTPNENWRNLTNKEIIRMYASDGSKHVHGRRGYQKHAMYSHWPCSVLFDQNDGTYIVRIHQIPIGGRYVPKAIWNQNKVPRILFNYPRSSIHFFVKPDVADHQMPNVFRHPIGLPDGIYPDHWNNKASLN